MQTLGLRVSIKFISEDGSFFYGPWFLAVTCSVSVLLEEHMRMDTMVYFYGSWCLTASFLLSVSCRQKCSGTLDCLVSSSTGELSSARTHHSKILDIISQAPF